MDFNRTAKFVDGRHCNRVMVPKLGFTWARRRNDMGEAELWARSPCGGPGSPGPKGQHSVDGEGQNGIAQPEGKQLENEKCHIHGDYMV